MEGECMKNLFVVITLVMILIAVMLYVSFRKFLKVHAEEEVAQNIKTIWFYIISTTIAIVLIGVSGVMMFFVEG